MKAIRSNDDKVSVSAQWEDADGNKREISAECSKDLAPALLGDICAKVGQIVKEELKKESK